jgi:hypothetical protein
MNLGTIRTRIKAFVKDKSTDTALQKRTNAEYDIMINEIHGGMAALTRMLESRVTTGVTAGTSEYDLPSIFLSPVQVLYLNSDGVYVPIEKKTEKELDMINDSWRDTTNTRADPPSCYYLRRNKIGLYPAPSITRASALRIDFIRRVDTMDADADIPFEGVYKYYDYHIGICYGVAELCMLDENKDSSRFARKYQEILMKIAREISTENEQTRIPNVYELNRENRWEV